MGVGRRPSEALALQRAKQWHDNCKLGMTLGGLALVASITAALATNWMLLAITISCAILIGVCARYSHKQAKMWESQA